MEYVGIQRVKLPRVGGECYRVVTREVIRVGYVAGLWMNAQEIRILEILSNWSQA
jgi:hypothetical protein